MASDPPLHEGGYGGSAPDEPSRSDIDLVGRALRNDWPITPKAKKQLLQRLMNIAIRSKYPRNRISAAKVIAQFMKLNLGQGALDLAREKLHGDAEDFTLADLVREAEQAALEHKPAEKPPEKDKRR